MRARHLVARLVTLSAVLVLAAALGVGVGCDSTGSSGPRDQNYGTEAGAGYQGPEAGAADAGVDVASDAGAGDVGGADAGGDNAGVADAVDDGSPADGAGG